MSINQTMYFMLVHQEMISNCTGYSIVISTCGPLDILRWLFETIIPLFILALGLLGNIIISVVVRRGRYKVLPAYYCLFVIGLVDTLWLVTNYLHFYVRKWYEHQPEWMNNVYCKLTGLFAYASTGTSSWVLCTMVIMRFATVNWPLKSISWFTIKRTRLFAVFLVLFTFAVHIPFIFIEEINETLNVCYHQHSRLATVLTTYHFVLFLAVPFVCLLIFNSLLSYQIRHLYTRKKVLSSATQSSLRRVSGSDAPINNRVTVMLVVTSWLYAALILPWYIQDIVYRIRSHIHEYEPTRMAINSICYSILMMNYSNNAYVYCFMYREFRNEVLLLFTRRRERSPLNSKTEERKHLNCDDIRPYSNAEKVSNCSKLSNCSQV